MGGEKQPKGSQNPFSIYTMNAIGKMDLSMK